MTGLDGLKRVSARLGADPLLVQGAGGNTSVKLNGEMWIKASGTELAEAESRDIFTPVDWRAYREALLSGPETPLDPNTFSLAGQGGLRPSIETPLHAVFPHKTVLHVHCVETIACAVRPDAEARLAERLDGHVRHHFIPYRRPGQPLVPGILEGLKKNASVFVLGNHGLIAAGDEPEDTAQALHEVSKRLASPLRENTKTAAPDLAALCRGTDFEPADPEISAAFLSSPDTKRILAGGPLYPDHVVFLGLAPYWRGAAEDARTAMLSDDAADAYVIDGHGAAVRRGAPAGAKAMLACMAAVLRRLPDGAELRHITSGECAELTNWDAEKYRRALNH